MSQRESWRTRKYWKSIGGLLIEEFLATKHTKTIVKRFIDGVIVLNEESRIFDGTFYNLEGKDIILIQTKHNRIGMSLLGQAFFSQFLIAKHKPKSIKNVAICSEYDEVMGQLAKDYEVEVIVIDDKEYDSQFDNPKYINKNKGLYNQP